MRKESVTGFWCPPLRKRDAVEAVIDGGFLKDPDAAIAHHLLDRSPSCQILAALEEEAKPPFAPGNVEAEFALLQADKEIGIFATGSNPLEIKQAAEPSAKSVAERIASTSFDF